MEVLEPAEEPGGGVPLFGGASRSSCGAGDLVGARERPDRGAGASGGTEKAQGGRNRAHPVGSSTRRVASSSGEVMSSTSTTARPLSRIAYEAGHVASQVQMRTILERIRPP